MKKNIYKKIFVAGAALFLLFAPVGVVVHGGMPTQSATQAPIKTSLAFPVSLKFDLALAATPTSTAPIGTTGAGAGTQTTNQTPDFFDCASSPVTCGVYYVSLVVNGAMSLFLTGGAWLVELGLRFNGNIFNSPAIQTGFSVSLAIANLGFVLGIIIIAIATIIRNQTYGMKQLLWKLVMMAVLVNFGLVITAPIVGFANSMSNYFINATSPSAATGGYEQYVLTLTSAFNPQVLLGHPTTAPAATSTTTIGSTITGGWTKICQSWLSTPIPGTPGLATYALCKGTSTSTKNPKDNFWQNTMALLFDIAFSAIAVFTFLCLAILLIVRYLMLGGLLIVLPLAWLTYIFPKFDNSFSKWWNVFIKWTFFPPIALFFIYLAFMTAVTTHNAQSGANGYTASVIAGSHTNTELTQGMTEQTGIGPDVFAQAADEILLAGLMIMGLMFANSLTGKAGKATVGAVSGGSKAFGTWVGKTGRRTGYNAAAWVAKPRPRVDPTTGALYSPITGPRANTARWLRGRAQRDNLKTPGVGVMGKSAGLAGSVWGGMKKGSGLFKNKNEVKDWECQHCHVTQRSTKKPTFACPSCHVPAATAKWTQV